MKIEGVKVDCHECSRSFYVNKDLTGILMCCPFCLSADILVYNEANIYIGKEVEGE